MSNPMINTLRDEWTEALRSGKYEQGVGVLKRDNKYCCLGVLCDISGYGEWEDDIYVTNDESFRLIPGPNFLSRVGLSLYDANHLGSLNDMRMPFDEIANWIDDYVPVFEELMGAPPYEF